MSGDLPVALAVITVIGGAVIWAIVLAGLFL